MTTNPFLELLKRNLFSIVVVGIAIVLMGGGLDFFVALISGPNYFHTLKFPLVTETSTIAILAYTIGFIGILLLWKSFVNWKVNKTFAVTQLSAGSIMVTGSWAMLQLTYWFAMK